MDIISYQIGKNSAPQPSGSLSITENGTYDVTDKASAVVNVQGGASGLPLEIASNCPSPFLLNQNNITSNVKYIFPTTTASVVLTDDTVITEVDVGDEVKTKLSPSNDYANFTYQWQNAVNIVSCIQSSGTQYIDTGYVPKTNTRIKTKLYITPYTQFDCPFGVRTGSTSKAFLLFTRRSGSANSCFNKGDSENFTSTPNMYNKWLDIETDSSNLYMYENNSLLYTLPFSGTSQNAEYNLFLFNLNERGSVYSGNVCATNCKMQFFKIYEDDTLIHHFIPAISQESGHENAVCLYDNVTHAYFYNQGSGVFVYEQAGDFTDISGATSSTYVTQTGDNAVRCILTGTGNAEGTITSSSVEVNEVD